MQRRITEAHLILIVTFVLYMGYQWLMQWIPIKNVIFHMLMGQVMLVLPGGLRYFACCRKKQDQLAERMLFVPISNANIKMAVAVIISAYPVIAILNSLSMLFVKNQVAAVMPYMMKLGYFPMLLVMAVMPALNEEFLCRGILYGAYRHHSKKAGIFLSALIFGLLHLNFNQMPYAVYLGIVFALMVEATGSIYTSMLMHFLLNGFNVTINFIADRMMTSYGNVNQQLSKTTESVSQTLSAVSCRQLVTMAVVLTVFLCFNGILIYSTFRINGRTMKNDCSKGRILDIFSVLFVIIALILTYINTDFL